jgi:hypothetical protein
MPPTHSETEHHVERQLEVSERIARLLGEGYPTWIEPVHFDGGAVKKLKVRQQRGPSCVSYGVYNPVAAKVYLGLFGATPSPGAFPVPPESALILPVQIPTYLDLGIDEAELGANTATIYVMRFETVQPFFLTKL